MGVGRGSIAILASHVALSLDQRVAQSKRLCQAYRRIIDRGISMWMVVSQDQSDHLSAFHRWTAREKTRLAHPGENTALHRLQTITSVAQRPVRYHRETVDRKGPPHADRTIFLADNTYSTVAF